MNEFSGEDKILAIIHLNAIKIEFIYSLSS